LTAAWPQKQKPLARFQKARAGEAQTIGARRDPGFALEQTSKRPPIAFQAPSGRFAETFRAFAGRTEMALERQSPDVLGPIAAAWDKGLAPFDDGQTIEVPMPAFVVSGRRKA
jgi:hypothetical protein